MSRGRGQRRLSGRWCRRWFAGLAAAVLIPAVSAAPAHADTTVAFTITDSRITESSGLARDRDHGIYWTVNDSGDSATVYGLDPSGSVLGTVNFRARVSDVEAVQYHDRALYVADIGDNDAQRRFVTVYVLYDTDPNNSTVLYRAYDLAYPDGPHDAETLLINGSGRIYLVTKGADAGIYRAPADPSRSGVNTLTRLADAPAYVTDGQILDDGRVALRSYTAVHVLDPNQGFREVGRAATPLQPQGESLTENLAGDALLVGSEGPSSQVDQMPIPAGLPAVPSAGPTPPANTSAGATPGSTPTSTASPGATASATGDGGAEPPAGSGADSASTSGGGRNGTATAVGLAALVAVIAGLIAALARRRPEATPLVEGSDDEVTDDDSADGDSVEGDSADGDSAEGDDSRS